MHISLAKPRDCSCCCRAGSRSADPKHSLKNHPKDLGVGGRACQSRWELAGMPWGRHRGAVGMPWGSCWDAMGMPWGWHRDGTGMLWLHLSPPAQQVRLPWPAASPWHRGKGHTAPWPELLPLAALSHGSRTWNVFSWGCSCWEPSPHLVLP